MSVCMYKLNVIADNYYLSIILILFRIIVTCNPKTNIVTNTEKLNYVRT